MNNRNRLFILLTLLVLVLVGIPTLIFLSQQRQETRSRASASTTLSFSPATSSSAPLQKTIGENVSFDVMISPGNNQASIVKLEIPYDTSKLQADSSPFVVNATAFPEIREGPLVQNGKILISISVGSDPSKAITQLTKVGTVNFSTISITNGTPTQISFGNQSQVLSVGSSDQATENVLSSTSPAYVLINSVPVPTSTPTPIPRACGGPNQPCCDANPRCQANLQCIPDTTTGVNDTCQPIATPTPTAIPTPTPTPLACGGLSQVCCTTSPICGNGLFCKDPFPGDGPNTCQPITPTTAPTPTPLPPTPTSVPTSVPTVIPTLGNTNLTLSVLIHGIGSAGDNSNSTLNSLSNKNPLHKTRNVKVEIFNIQNQLIATENGIITYDNTTGNFKGILGLTSIFPGTGIYTIKVQSPTHLRRLVPGVQPINLATVNAIPEISIIAGDTNSDNALNILDYNIIAGCYSDLAPATSCGADNKLLADLNDDGAVNQFDYNLFLREIIVQNGQ